MPSFCVRDSVAFVTGASKPNGMGQTIVVSLLSAGAAKVYATARYASQLDDLVATHAGKVVAVELYVTNIKGLEALADLYPDVTLIVNNAAYAGFTNSTQDVKKSLVEVLVNYIALLAISKSFSTVFAKLAVKLDLEGESPKPSALVNVNSISSFVNFPIFATFSASQAAGHSLTEAQRRDMKGTLVIGVYPGPIDTDAPWGIVGEKASPSEVASAIVEALQHGTEDAFPDIVSKSIYNEWKSDAKRLERNMAT